MAEQLYWKMWRSWWTGESHVDLEADGLSIGPVLMSFIRWERGKDEGWAVKENGKPVTIAAIAARAKWTPERTVAALQDLADAKTIRLRRDGAWGFPKWGPWQESSEAARKRKVRGQSPDKSGKCPPDVPALVEVEVDQNSSSSGRGKPADPKPPDPFKPAIDRVLQVLHETRIAVKPGLTRLRKRDNIRARLAEGAPVEHLLAVIAFAGEECRKDPTKLEWLNAETPFRPKNWESRLARAQAWQATARSGPRLDLTIDDLDRKRAEVEAWEASRRPQEAS